MPTPLYDALKAYAKAKPARFHMPGHKGRPLPAPELARLAVLDVTELPGTGNLYEAGAPFDAAQELWAELYHFDCCQFLTGGSTMGILTGMTLLCPPGSRVLLDRGCHRSVFNALALLDLEPVFLERDWMEGEGMGGPIRPEQVEQALREHPEIRTVCVTSPTYAGILSDIWGISQAVHAHGGRLLVDGAHGAHLPFLGLQAFDGADVLAVSAHKTLPAMGQSALLFASGVEPERIRRMASIYGSSSPSYPMLASLDTARQWLVENSGEYHRTARRVVGLREKFPALDGLPLDPCRLTVRAKDGHALKQALEERNIWPEMADLGHVVFICTAQDREKSFERLEQALEELRGQLGACPPVPAPPAPERVLSPREALFSPVKKVLLADAAGEISAVQVAPYPPGVPVVAPGERITKKALAYLQETGYNMQTEISISVRTE